jgi:Protein of unknown function (DUF4058)
MAGGLLQDVHASLLVYARDRLNAELPAGLQARVDKRLAIDAEPERPLRHIEIVDSRTHVITAIELLSPSNKAGSEAVVAWSRKRFDYLRGGINLVEIDLLRGGIWTLPDRSLLKPVPPGRLWHYVCVTRAPWSGQHEFYMLPLRQRLPAIRVPLRRADPDVALDLQLLIDQCYERGRYGTVLDYRQPPQPALPDEEAAWVQQMLGARP